MPDYPIAPYAPTALYQRNSRLMDLMLRQGSDAAEAEARRGLVRGQLVANIGETLGKGISDIQQYKREEPERQLRLRDLQGRAAESELKIRAAAHAEEGQRAVAAAMQQYPDDPKAAAQALARAGHADSALAYFKTLTDLEKAYQPEIENAAPGSMARNKVTGALIPDSQVPVLPQVVNPETERHNRELERIATLTAGRAEATQTETVRHNKAMEARPVAGAVTANTPGNWDLTGDAFIETIPQEWQATVKKIAHYDEDPTKVTSMRGGMRERLMQWVNQANPSYDASTFSNRAPTRKAFTTGTQGQQINSINTAIGHIDQLEGVAAALENRTFVPGNRVWNEAKAMFGKDAPTNFDTLKDALAGEVAGVLAKGGSTVSGIAEAKQKISTANSPAQLRGYVRTLIPIMGSKLGELNFQYHQAMGEADPFQTLSPESRRILIKLGIDPDQPTIPTGTGGGGSQKVGRFDVTVSP